MITVNKEYVNIDRTWTCKDWASSALVSSTLPLKTVCWAIQDSRQNIQLLFPLCLQKEAAEKNTTFIIIFEGTVVINQYELYTKLKELFHLIYIWEKYLREDKFVMSVQQRRYKNEIRR